MQILETIEFKMAAVSVKWAMVNAASLESTKEVQQLLQAQLTTTPDS